MNGTIGIGRRFDELHSRFMPRAYQMAVWLLGDAAKAENAAGRAFIRAVETAKTPDAREFGVSCARLLLEECGCSRMSSGEPDASRECGVQELMFVTGDLDRNIVTLAVCGRFSVPEIAMIVRRPERRVEKCIQSAAKRLCMESRDYSAVTAS